MITYPPTAAQPLPAAQLPATQQPPETGPREPAAPLAILQAVGATLTRHGYLATAWCGTTLAGGLSAALGLAGLKGPGAGRVDRMPVVQGLGGRSRWIDLDGPVHYLDFGGPADGPLVVCVHGLVGMAANWSALAPLLTGRYRVIAPDLAGHGLTRSLARGTDVGASRTLLHRFIEAVSAGPVILIGNSMGGMISLLEASAAPGLIAGLVLIDPVLPLVPTLPDWFVTPMLATLVTPVLGPLLMGRFRRMSPESLVACILSLCCVDVSRVPADALAAQVTVARETLRSNEVERDVASAARSIIATAAYLRGAAYRRHIQSITRPVLLLHGTHDRLVPIAVARAAARANPAWTFVEMPGVGHLPELEAPRETAYAIIGWLGSAGLCRASSLEDARPYRVRRENAA